MKVESSCIRIVTELSKAIFELTLTMRIHSASVTLGEMMTDFKIGDNLDGFIYLLNKTKPPFMKEIDSTEDFCILDVSYELNSYTNCTDLGCFGEIAVSALHVRVKTRVGLVRFPTYDNSLLDHEIFYALRTHNTVLAFTVSVSNTMIQTTHNTTLLFDNYFVKHYKDGSVMFAKSLEQLCKDDQGIIDVFDIKNCDLVKLDNATTPWDLDSNGLVMTSVNLKIPFRYLVIDKETLGVAYVCHHVFKNIHGYLLSGSSSKTIYYAILTICICLLSSFQRY